MNSNTFIELLFINKILSMNKKKNKILSKFFFVLWTWLRWVVDFGITKVHE